MTTYRKTIIRFGRPLVLLALTLTGFVTSTGPQEVSIPDPGLNAAIRTHRLLPGQHRDTVPPHLRTGDLLQ